MTKEQYIEKAAKTILKRLFEDIRNYASLFTSDNETKEYSLPDLKSAIVPGNKRDTKIRFSLCGYGMEIIADWPYYLYFRNGILIIGNNKIPLRSFEHSVATLQYLSKVLPDYVLEFKKGLKNIYFEIEKHKMLEEIYEANIMSEIGPLIKDTGIRVRVILSDSNNITCLINQCGKRKVFQLSNENMAENMEEIKNYINSVFL